MEANTALVWTEPIERGDLKLAPGDINESITWFKEKAGIDPQLIMLCPKNKAFAGEIPDTIDVIFLGGVLRGEIFLSASKNWGAHQTLQTPPETTKSKSGVTKIQDPAPDAKTVFVTQGPPVKIRRRVNGGGRKKIKLPERKILAWASVDMSPKNIAAKLRDKNIIDVSAGTIRNFLKSKQPRLGLPIG